MATPSQADRNKAHRLRKQRASGEIKEIDLLWLEKYEEDTDGSGGRGPQAKEATNFGASQSKKKVHREETIEEEHQAVGTGSAAATAVGQALTAREEGRRLDSLFDKSIGALHEATEVYKAVCTTLLEREKVREETHQSMLEAVRDHFLARTEAEAELVAKEREKTDEDPANGLMVALLPAIAKHLGVDLPMGAAPPRNGARKAKPSA